MSSLLEEEKEQTMKYQGKTIHKSINNTWYTRYRLNGKQYYISAKTQKDCYNKLVKAIKGAKQNILETPTIKRLKPITKLKDWIQTWLETYKKNKVRESTYKGIEYLINKHFKGDLFNKDIETIKQIDIERFLNNVQLNRVKERGYIYLKDIFRRAVNNDLIAKNPLEDIDKPTYEKKQNRALTKKEQKMFEEYCLKDKAKHIYLVCLWQGLRIGELRAVTKEDINLEKNTLKIDKSQNDQTKDTKTKNKYSNRIMPIFENTREVLLNYEFDKNKLSSKSKDYIERKFKEIILELNIQDVTMHSLRHTFITRCQEKNIPLYIIQSWVGHAQGSEVTTKIYTHKQEEVENKYINIFNDDEKD